MCEPSSSRFFRFRSKSFAQKTEKTANRNKSVKAAPKKDDDRASKSGDSENENAVCGQKCLTMPKVVYAK